MIVADFRFSKKHHKKSEGAKTNVLGSFTFFLLFYRGIPPNLFDRRNRDI